MFCLIFFDGRYRVSNVQGFTPPGLIGCLPDETLQNEYPFIIQENESFHVCPDKLSNWLKERIKNDV